MGRSAIMPYPLGDEVGDSPPRSEQGIGQPATLFINGRFIIQQITGVQRVAHELVREIDSLLGSGELQARIILLVPPGRWVQKLALKRIEVRTIGRVGGLFWENLALARHVGARPLLCLGNTAPVWSLLRGHPVSVMIHDVSYLNHARAYRLGYRLVHRLLLPLLLRRARTVITVSQTEQERLEAIEPRVAERTLVAQNGGWSEAACLPSPDRAVPSPGYALYVGSLSHRKNFDRILQAAITLAREDGIDFVFVGSAGSVLRAPTFDIPPDVAHRIHFLGQVNDRSSLGRLYAEAGVLVFPSLYEASPLPPVEAAHFGCPAVVSNIPSMWERCGDSVMYCDPRSVPSIIAAVRRVLLDPSARTRLRGATAGLAEGRSWADQARTICRRILPGQMQDRGLIGEPAGSQAALPPSCDATPAASSPALASAPIWKAARLRASSASRSA